MMYIRTVPDDFKIELKLTDLERDDTDSDQLSSDYNDGTDSEGEEIYPDVEKLKEKEMESAQPAKVITTVKQQQIDSSKCPTKGISLLLW